MPADWNTVLSDPPSYLDLDTCSIAYRQVGQRDPLVFNTGWPFNQSTYYNLLPYLVDDYTRILLDSPGLGETQWGDSTDFTFPGQAGTFRTFLDKLGVNSCALVAHNTGATIARLIVADDLQRFRQFVILNTEIPKERPPWFPLYAKVMRLPGSRVPFQLALRSRAFVRSSMGLGAAYDDKALLNDDFVANYVRPLIDDNHRFEGASRYLRIGLDFKLIDALPDVHRRITISVHLVWGANDPTFPIEPAKAMVADFPNCDEMTVVPNGKLLSHEEFPQLTASAIRHFLKRSTKT